MHRVKAELMAMGYKDSEVGQAMRMAGGTSVECAVTWLLSREETPGGTTPGKQNKGTHDTMNEKASKQSRQSKRMVNKNNTRNKTKRTIHG